VVLPRMFHVEFSTGGDNHLSVVNTDVARKINQRGICLINTMVLMNNKVHQNKGCWCPQTPVDLIKMSPETEG
jgi:hypothetical protein